MEFIEDQEALQEITELMSQAKALKLKPLFRLLKESRKIIKRQIRRKKKLGMDGLE